MKKTLKFLLKLVLGIVVLVVIAVLALPLWFGPVGKSVANSVVPDIVGTDFHLGVLALNPYTGYFETGDMQLSNPVGYFEKYAVTLGSLVVDLEPLSVATDVIHIEEVTVRDVFVSYVRGGVENVNNFDQIQYNVAGGKDKYEAKQAEKKAEEAHLQATAPEGKAPEAKPADAEKPGKKVIIDRLTISGVSIKLGPVPIKIPVDIKLTDIGRKTGGATLAEAWEQIFAAVCNAAGALGDQLRAIGGLAGEAAKQAAAMANQATKAVGDAAGQATKAVGDVTGQATKAVGDAAGQATKAVSGVTDSAAKATEGATKAVGDAAKKATEGATKALDSLKSLW